MKINKVPQSHQKEAIQFCLKRNRAIICHKTGRGKACRNGTGIRTMEGIVPIENLNIGTKVLSSDGNFYPVTGVFPQGSKQLYRVCFSDNTFLDVSGEHLWKVHTYTSRCQKWSKLYKKWEVLKTEDMINNTILNTKLPRLNYSIPYVQPIQYTKKKLNIPPYVLGCLLGDGCISGTCRTISLSNIEEPIINKFKSYLPEFNFRESITHSGHAKNTHIIQGKDVVLSNTLRTYGLYGCKSENKFIPKDYLQSTIQDRLRLLEGLLDTDGYIRSNHNFEYYTISPKLRDDVVELIKSLGGRATYKVKPTWCTYRGKRYKTKDTYRITGTLFDITQLELVKKHQNKNWSKKPQRTEKYITDIQKIDIAECTCISIDSPDHTFVTENYTVTHNSITLLCTAFLQIEHYNIDNAIVVSTNSGLRSLTNELKNTFDSEPISLKDFRQGKKGIVFVAYQNLDTFLDNFPKGRFSLFLDEFHKVKSSKTQTTILSNKLKQKCVNRYGYTATPIMKEIKDLYCLIKWMNPMILGSWESFCQEYTMFYRIPTPKGFDVIKPYRYRNYEKLKRKLDDIIHSYYPSSNIEYVEHYIPLENIEGYRKTREDALAPTGDDDKDKALPMQAVKKCKHFVALSRGKFIKLKEILDSVVSEYGAIVYCDEYYTLDPVNTFLNRCGFKVLKYTGKSTQKEKDKSFEDFTKNAKGKILLVSRVGGASLNLQSTNQLVMVDMPSSLGAVLQLLGRTDRMDSEYDTFYMHLLLTKNSVESYWYDYIKLYSEPLQRLFGNGDIPKGMPNYNEFIKKKLINDNVWNR